MTRALPISRETESHRTAEANSRGARACTKTGKGLHPISAFAPIFRALWPRKTCAELQARTGISERMAKYLLSERYSLSADHLTHLLRSDDGLRVLEALMTDKPPAWWRDFKRQVRRTTLRRQIRELQNKFDEEDQAD